MLGRARQALGQATGQTGREGGREAASQQGVSAKGVCARVCGCRCGCRCVGAFARAVLRWPTLQTLSTLAPSSLLFSSLLSLSRRPTAPRMARWGLCVCVYVRVCAGRKESPRMYVCILMTLLPPFFSPQCLIISPPPPPPRPEREISAALPVCFSDGLIVS